MQSVKGDWEGIPGQWITDFSAIDGRRFVASPAGVSKLRVRMSEQAKKRCEICGNWCYSGDRHHVYGRGIGGGKKEDRPEINGIRFVLWVDRRCHTFAVIKPWGSWSLGPPESAGLVPAESSAQ